ncbi:metal-binding protein [Leisingera methylohalidivorans DSM 14336]|uniref:Metal-binding protein n=1 Tax=Leisingera methylohalidivorans DSM 14336 TaxID=999552 RepID=V9VRJ6_9RHOB|nr:metal-binding protein [Leisingera methylohalidivorans DSM 14336]
MLAAVGVILLLSLLYTVSGAGMEMSAVEMTRMARPIGEPMQMGAVGAWTPGYAALIFLMWWIMMIAMMTPSAAPVLLLYTAIKKAGARPGQAPLLGLLFLCGYLLAWAVFSFAATALQWWLETAGLSDGPMMSLSSRALGGTLLLAAGTYQFTPCKHACLFHCRMPVQFLTAHNRTGLAGAVLMGAHHGVFCLGCCWALMLLLFAGGVMNLYWITGLALYVLAEKHAPDPRLFACSTGGLLVLAGCYVLATAF